jgi:N-acetylglutamate synthase-like GNAT family acetyltransferase
MTGNVDFSKSFKFSWGRCVLRDRAGGCTHYGGVKCDLRCNLYKFMVEDIKKLLDNEIEKATMTSHPRENIIKSLIDGDAIVVLSLEDEVIGFVYLKHWLGHIEIAGLVVEDVFRKHGLGVKLFSEIIFVAESKYESKKIIFFANDASGRLGKKFGFVAQPDLLEDTEFQELCKGCTKEYKKPVNCYCHVMIKQD